MNSETSTTPDPKKNVEFNFDGQKLTLSIPISVGRIGTYGAIMMAFEMAQKIFAQAEQKAVEVAKPSILERMHLPGLRRH